VNKKCYAALNGGKNRKSSSLVDLLHDVSDSQLVKEDKVISFERECGHFLIEVANRLSTSFERAIACVFPTHNVSKLSAKSLYFVGKEVECMSRDKHKSPFCASIRDYLSSLVVFSDIDTMIKGYKKLEKFCDEKNSKYHIKICKIDNKMICKKQFERNSILEHFRYISINVVFGHKKDSLKMIGEIIFTLDSVWQQLGRKQLIIDAYAKILSKKRTEQIEMDFEMKLLKYTNDKSAQCKCQMRKLKKIKNVYSEQYA